MKTYHGAKDGWLEEAVKTKPFGRLIDPKEVARACAYPLLRRIRPDDRARISISTRPSSAPSDPPIEP